jgi:hypothetical protein
MEIINKVVERKELLDILKQWQVGVISEREVHERSEALIDNLGELPNYPKNDPRAIAVEVLLHLDILNHQLITPKDIPEMQAFLHTPHGNELRAWDVWRTYWNNIDIENRRQELKNNPYYCT